jgi:hypothetical protein
MPRTTETKTGLLVDVGNAAYAAAKTGASKNEIFHAVEMALEELRTRTHPSLEPPELERLT